VQGQDGGQGQREVDRPAQAGSGAGHEQVDRVAEEGGADQGVQGAGEGPLVETPDGQDCHREAAEGQQANVGVELAFRHE
jgi:hypothetical protein